MRIFRLAFLLVAAAVCASACAVTGAYYRSPSLQPDYVYLYPDGCWADDQWYSPCPWAPGPRWGYYRHFGGYYYWQDRYYWEYRPGYPPPGYWRHQWRGHPQVPHYPARPPHHHPPHHRR